MIGLKFWKVGSRKIYAVKLGELNHPTQNKSTSKHKPSLTLDSNDDDDDDDFQEPVRKKSKPCKVSEELREIKADLQSVVRVTKYMKYLPGLYISILRAFKCNLCLHIITPPVIFARCCKNILGCEKCVNELYIGDHCLAVKCPLCWCDRAFSETCKINGLDDFFNDLKPMFEISHVSTSDSDDELFTSS